MNPTRATPAKDSRWRTFAAAPHRMLFAGGALALVLSMLWWGAILLGRAGWPGPAASGLVPTWTHAWLMVYGVFPFFVLGFLLTAFPRWIGAPPVAPGLYQPVALGLIAGLVLVVLGALFSATMVTAGMVVTVVAWLAGLAALAARLKGRLAGNKLHPPWALVVLGLGLAGAVLSAWGAARLSPWAMVVGPRLGIWGFLAPMVFIVSHRMLPFFAQAAIPGYVAFRPVWAPAVCTLLFIIHAGLMMAGTTTWLWLADAPLAIITAWLLWRWQPWRARANPLLWTLFAAFFWLPVALALSAIQSLAALSGIAILGLAPLHVLAIGVLTSMVLAMATRVSLGHSGQALRMDRLSLASFVVIQIAVGTRLLAEVPGLADSRLSWLIATAGLWLLAMIPWALRWIVRYWQPRVDGQPG